MNYLSNQFLGFYLIKLFYIYIFKIQIYIQKALKTPFYTLHLKAIPKSMQYLLPISITLKKTKKAKKKI